MVYIMNRYQIYLDPASVGTIDDIASGLDLNRSHVIRDVISRVAREYAKMLGVARTWSKNNDPLLKMAGIGKSSTGNISQDVDSIYFQD